MAKGYRVSPWVDESAPELTVVMVVFICEYTKNYWIIHFKWVNCMVCHLYFDIAVKK